MASPTHARPRVIRAAAPADPSQLPGALAADLVRRATANPAAASLGEVSVGAAGSSGVTVAAIIVQTGTADPAAPSLTTLAARLADDVKELLQGEPSARPVSAAVAVSGPVTIADGESPLVDVADEPDPADPIVIDRARRRVLVAGDELDLTYREFELLAYLAENRGRVFSRAHLLRTVWDHAPVGSRTVDVHVRRLRVKLGPAADRITTVRSVGYRLEPAANRSLEPVA